MIDIETARDLATAYTAAWNSGSPEAVAGSHVAYFWTFTGTHASTKNRLRVVGWEEWDLDGDLKVVASRGWYDADDYARQTAPT